MTKPTPRKGLDYYLSRPYPIELIPDEDGSWFAHIPLLDGCMTTGSDAHDALNMILDAQRGWLLTALELGLDIPEPPAHESAA